MILTALEHKNYTEKQIFLPTQGIELFYCLAQRVLVSIPVNHTYAITEVMAF